MPTSAMIQITRSTSLMICPIVDIITHSMQLNCAENTTCVCGRVCVGMSVYVYICCMFICACVYVCIRVCWLSAEKEERRRKKREERKERTRPTVQMNGDGPAEGIYCGMFQNPESDNVGIGRLPLQRRAPCCLRQCLAGSQKSVTHSSMMLCLRVCTLAERERERARERERIRFVVYIRRKSQRERARARERDLPKRAVETRL